MAVFPDYISLKNSADPEANIIAAIEAGGDDEINQGEVVIGLNDGFATLYTRDAVGNIVKLQGAVQSVNDQDEVVSLGIQDMNDYEPQIGNDGPVYDFSATSNQTPPAGIIARIGTSSEFAANVVDDNGVDWETQWYDEDLTKGIVLLEYGNIVNVLVNGTFLLQTAFYSVSNRDFDRVHFSFREDDWMDDLVDGDVIQLNIQGWTELPLADNDLLQYNEEFGKFMPVPPTIDGLIDVDTTTVAPTDGQALVWDNANSQWEPGTISGGGTSLPSGSSDGEALIWENGAWAVGPVIGGVNYATGAGDPYFSDVSVLLLGNGSNDSTTFTDSSSNNLTITTSSTSGIGPRISTSNSKFGGSSIFFNINGDEMVIGNSGTVSGDFTVEFWMNSGDTASQSPACIIFSSKAAGYASDNFLIMRAQGGELLIYSDVVINWPSPAVNYCDNLWHHIAVTRSGTDLTIWADGVNVGTVTNSTTFDFTNSRLGIRGDSNSSSSYSGYIDDFRITEGVARYTANFTPPTAELPTISAANTVIPYSIDKLDDVDITTVAPTDGQALVWDNANSQWEPGSIPPQLTAASARTLLGIGEYVDDAAAGTGGVASGALYYNTTNSNYVLKT